MKKDVVLSSERKSKLEKPMQKQKKNKALTKLLPLPPLLYCGKLGMLQGHCLHLSGL